MAKRTALGEGEKQYRTFDGRLFKLYYEYPSRKEAKQTANLFRTKYGHFVRILKRDNKYALYSAPGRGK